MDFTMKRLHYLPNLTDDFQTVPLTHSLSKHIIIGCCVQSFPLNESDYILHFTLT